MTYAQIHHIVGEQVGRSELQEENDRTDAAGNLPATYENVLLGVFRYRVWR